MNCWSCDRFYSPVRKTQFTCNSDNCRKKFRKHVTQLFLMGQSHPMALRNCVICKDSYAPRTANQKTCCAKCRGKMEYQRDKAAGRNNALEAVTPKQVAPKPAPPVKSCAPAEYACAGCIFATPEPRADAGFYCAVGRFRACNPLMPDAKPFAPFPGAANG